MVENITELSDDIKLRPINCELNFLSRTDGSAFLTQGETAVLASMHGPVEGKPQNMKIESAAVEVVYRPKAGLPTVKDKLRETIIRNTCETAMMTALHPRTAISIQLQEMENKSGLEACAVNASCLALLISGISMKFTVAGVHCIIDKDGDLVLDPDHRQANGSLASFTFVFDSIDKNLVACSTEGKFNLGQYNEALLLSKAACEIVFTFFRNIIAKTHRIESEEKPMEE